MISAAPASQALLARSALRTAATASRVATAIAAKSARTSTTTASAAVSYASRSYTASAVQRQAAAVEVPTVVAPAALTPTNGRKRRNGSKPTTESDKAKLLLKWGWFEPGAPEIKQLATALQTGTHFPEWLKSTFDNVKSFRSARARLWTPTLEEIRAFVGSDATSINDPQQWIDEQVEAYREKLEVADAKVSKAAKHNNPDYLSEVELWDLMDYEQQTDFALRSVWNKLSDSQKQDALLRTRYESLRKLGWRQGYSSGYPRPEGESSHLPTQLGVDGEAGWAAFRELQKAEDAQAWAAWQRLSPEERVAEEKAAWKLRDRSQVYIDDSEDSLILGSSSPRWYPVPERAGELTFLPNTVIKLVKNHTPEGQEYDGFKATFRVPLSMHKHAFVRTFSASTV